MAGGDPPCRAFPVGPGILRRRQGVGADPEGLRCGPPDVTGPAPLAQSAERLHGKEKVESSILSGSSRRRSILRRFPFALVVDAAA
jgi:hypothetical protein